MKLKGVCIGSGYFSQFHYEAWSRIPEVKITALASMDASQGHATAQKYRLRFYEDYQEMLLQERPDFVDIITPPDTHASIATFAADLGIQVICQKPITPNLSASVEMVNQVTPKVRMIVHENFRFQPWHREILRQIRQERVGKLHHLSFRSRMGDGWADDAYLARQPYFRTYPRLLIYETGIHFIDLFRCHTMQEPAGVFARLKRLNPEIKGEDAGIMMLDFEEPCTAMWDADRYHDNNYPKDRYTFGEYLVEGEKGSLRLYADGKITWQALGQPEAEMPYKHEDRGFAGDSCYLFQRHAVESLLSGMPAETEANIYLHNLKIQEAVYQSAESRQYVSLASDPQPRS
ncbi:MAG: Gfo/Idh/MocA family oxidoreductase [Bacteroidia bacterium]|nr:Gfo/Idh/MocA family oxidoreductase [Bacteroidia bacterium]